MNVALHSLHDSTLAAGDIARAVAGHNERVSSITALGYIVAALCIVVLMWAVLGWWERFVSRRSRPATLFDELAEAHGLNGGDRELLRAVARENGFDEPAMVFVRPDAVAAAQPSRAARAERLEELHRRLFT